jgi:hypothetical protein
MLVGVIQASVAPVASADRPPPDITCATGEPATYRHGAHRFRERLLVLGCTRLGGGRRLQVDGWAGRGSGHKLTCLDLTRRAATLGYACLRHGGPSARVLLLMRDHSTAPVLAFGVAPAETERVAASYLTATGTTGEARATLLHVGADLAKKVSARRGFAIFIAELGPRANACGGITPRAFGRSGRRLISQRAVPTHQGSMGLPGGGWLVGFTRTWGIGSGSPTVCGHGALTGREGSRELVGDRGAGDRAAGEADAAGQNLWPAVAGVAGIAVLIALIGIRRLKVLRSGPR